MNNGNITFEDIIGRYLTISIKNEDYRIYVEENGQGIPLICLHTAGSDGRQFRHILNDKKITKHYRVLLLICHGMANPIHPKVTKLKTINLPQVYIKK